MCEEPLHPLWWELNGVPRAFQGHIVSTGLEAASRLPLTRELEQGPGGRGLAPWMDESHFVLCCPVRTLVGGTQQQSPVRIKDWLCVCTCVFLHA